MNLKNMGCDHADIYQKVCIIGQNSDQYESLSDYLTTELNAKSLRYDELSLAGCSHAYSVWLIDFLLFETDEFVRQITNLMHGPHMPALVALFNVPRDFSLDTLIIKYKIRGTFFEDDSSDVIIKGMRCILDGGLWLPRKILSNCILKYRSRFDATLSKGSILSGRERDILQNVASGATNQEIADSLDISVNTVKTHLYNIYRKINVPNRLQASIWANLVLHKFSGG